MSPMKPISDEQLNAFVDQQLDHNDRKHVLNATITDHDLAEEVYSLYQMKELVQQAYRDPPGSSRLKNPVRNKTRVFRWAAVLIICTVSAVAGYQWSMDSTFAKRTFFDTATIQATSFAGKRVLVHVDSNDPVRIQTAMQTVEMLMRNKRPAEIEVVANGPGLLMVRQGSPHAARVHALATRYANLEFRACGFAMEATRLKEGSPVVLVPEAVKVDAALNEILRRLKEGWVYIKA